MGSNIPPEDDPSSIGNVLVSMGVLDKETLDKLLVEFRRKKDELLGEFIRDKIGCTEGMIDLALMRQTRMRGDNGSSAVQKAINIARRTQTRIVIKVEEMAAVADMLKNNAK